MKVFVIGGVSVQNEHAEYDAQVAILKESMAGIGSSLIRTGHDLLVCSPYPGAADLEAVRGAVEAFAESSGPIIEFHTPNLPSVKERLEALTRSLASERVKSFYHPICADE